MKFQANKENTSRKGSSPVLVGFGLVGILGVVAISFDGGGMMSERRHAQAVADAAALAAAADLYDWYWINYGDDPDETALDSAFLVARENGYDNAGEDKVIVNI